MSILAGKMHMRLMLFSKYLLEFSEITVPDKYQKLYEKQQLKGQRIATIFFRLNLVPVPIVAVILPAFSCGYNIAMENFNTKEWFNPFQLV